MANRILEGVRRQCLRTKGKEIFVVGPIGPMPAFLLQSGFVPEFPLRNLIPKITGNKGSFILKDLSNPLYGLDQEDGKKESV